MLNYIVRCFTLAALNNIDTSLQFGFRISTIVHLLFTLARERVMLGIF